MWITASRLSTSQKSPSSSRRNRYSVDTQVSAGANTPRLTEAVGSTGPRGCASSTPTSLASACADEAAVVLEDQVVLGVVGGQFDLAAAGQRPALAAELGARDVGQHGLPVGGGEELDDVRRARTPPRPASTGRWACRSR